MQNEEVVHNEPISNQMEEEEEEFEETYADKVDALREIYPNQSYYLGYAKTEQVLTLKEDQQGYKVELEELNATVGNFQKWILTIDGWIASAQDKSLVLQIQNSQVIVAKKSKKHSTKWQIVFIEADIATRHKYICVANNRRLILDKNPKNSSLSIRMNNDTNDEAQKWVVFAEIPSKSTLLSEPVIVQEPIMENELSDDNAPIPQHQPVPGKDSPLQPIEHRAHQSDEEERLFEELSLLQKKMESETLPTPLSTKERVFKTLKSIMSFQSFVTLFLAVAMLATGTCNTLLTKAQDLQVVKGFGDKPALPYEHALFVNYFEIFFGHHVKLFFQFSNGYHVFG